MRCGFHIMQTKSSLSFLPYRFYGPEKGKILHYYYSSPSCHPPIKISFNFHEAGTRPSSLLNPHRPRVTNQRPPQALSLFVCPPNNFSVFITQTDSPNQTNNAARNYKPPRLSLSGGGAPPLRNRNASILIGKAVTEASHPAAVLNAVFQPLEEVKKELLLVPVLPQSSLARHVYSDACEVAINDQINVEYSVSYVYHAMYAYFNRDNVALKGLAKFLKEASVEERKHAEKFMEYQNKRGGKVKLYSLMMPLSDYDHLEKGDALYAMERALSLEKVTNEKLLNLHKIADENNDPQLADFIESDFLEEQVESIKKISEYVEKGWHRPWCVALGPDAPS